MQTRPNRGAAPRVRGTRAGMARLLSVSRPPRPALVALVLAAIAFAIGGVDHARLYHRGYAEVEVVGPLFLLNAIGTLAVLLIGLTGRIRLFMLGVLAISLGSIVSILFSHEGSFFGFREGGWDGDATLIIAVEIASVLLVLVAGALGALRDEETAAAPAAARPAAPQLALAAVAAVVLVLPMAGVATGSAPKGDPAPTGAALTASKQAIANGNMVVQRGKEEFEEEHCDSCHAIAATGAKGKLGPRMDAQGDPLKEIVGNITDPRSDIAEGYEGKLMPTDYASRMDADEIKALATFIKAASAGSSEGRGGGGDGDEG